MKNGKNYQIILQVLGACTTLIAMIVGLVLLYYRIDASGGCPWCKYISCVQIPPGDPAAAL